MLVVAHGSDAQVHLWVAAWNMGQYAAAARGTAVALRACGAQQQCFFCSGWPCQTLADSAVRV
jgi:hypothetical protein